MDVDNAETGYCLVRVGPAQSSLVFKLYEKNLIGRGLEASLPIFSMFVSRNHCQIYQQESNWYIRDCGTLNGTFIGDTKLESATVYLLKPGDVIGLGINLSSLEELTRPEEYEHYYVYKLMKTNGYDLDDLCSGLSCLMQY